MNIQVNSSAILLSASIFLASCAGSKEEQPINEIPIVVSLGAPSAKGTNNIYVSGVVEPKETSIISTRVMGFITSMKAKPGDKVRKGQLLVTINSADILAKRAQAQAIIAEAEAATTDAKKDYERFTELYNSQSSSAKELENARLRYNSAKAKLEAAHELRNEADAMLTYCNLTAPFSGVVAQKNIDEGSMASPGAPILVIEQTDNYQVKATVSDAEVGLVKEGATAIVTIKSTGSLYHGRVSEISPSSHLSGGQYAIKVSLTVNEETGLFSGMYVNVSIPTNINSENDNPLVPLSAIIHKDQLTGLYTVGEDHTAFLHWVKLGKEFGDKIEILSGLNASEHFIAVSEGKLYNGAPVVVK